MGGRRKPVGRGGSSKTTIARRQSRQRSSNNTKAKGWATIFGLGFSLISSLIPSKRDIEIAEATKLKKKKDESINNLNNHIKNSISTGEHVNIPMDERIELVDLYKKIDVSFEIAFKHKSVFSEIKSYYDNDCKFLDSEYCISKYKLNNILKYIDFYKFLELKTGWVQKYVDDLKAFSEGKDPYEVAKQLREKEKAVADLMAENACHWLETYFEKFGGVSDHSRNELMEAALELKFISEKIDLPIDKIEEKYNDKFSMGSRYMSKFDYDLYRSDIEPILNGVKRAYIRGGKILFYDYLKLLNEGKDESILNKIMGELLRAKRDRITEYIDYDFSLNKWRDTIVDVFIPKIQYGKETKCWHTYVEFNSIEDFVVITSDVDGRTRLMDFERVLDDSISEAVVDRKNRILRISTKDIDSNFQFKGNYKVI